VNIALDNAHGEESKSAFYRKCPRLNLFHYQCSKSSTSTEIASVFDRAIQRQTTDQGSKHLSLVFMDEAGLPEEGRESLKVIHYYLEGHMSSKCPVAFVAITNHVLDAAKSNRCVCLLRPEPGIDELETIASGVLFENGASSSLIRSKQLAVAEKRMTAEEFVSRLCETYARLIRNDQKFHWFESFFGLRDFIYFLRAVRSRLDQLGPATFQVSAEDFFMALAHNFNGCSQAQFRDIVLAFVAVVLREDHEAASGLVSSHIPQTFDLVSDALSGPSEVTSVQSQGRYKLIIDETDDDSIMRLLSFSTMLDVSQDSLFKLSGMSEDSEIEKLALISGVKFAALRGKVAVLSQTESINESFYDLFNQNFRRLEKDGKVSHFANIAAGGISRPCLVHKDFRCFVHIRSSQLSQVPAPFLNRFEKFRLSVAEVLVARLGGCSNLLRIIKLSIEQAGQALAPCGIYGSVKGQTIESIVLDVSADYQTLMNVGIQEQLEDRDQMDLAGILLVFLNGCFPGAFTAEDVTIVMDTAYKFLPVQDANILTQFVSKGAFMAINAVASHFENILSYGPDSSLQRMLNVVFEMTLTRFVVFKCLPLATPEAMFAHR
jgi:hypothetical protein